MRELVDRILAKAGIQANGPMPWDIQVRDARFFQRVLAGRNLGLGESYMDGWWDCGQLDEFFARLLRSGVEGDLKGTPSLVLRTLKARLLNAQTRTRSREVALRHYDLGNDLFQAMLDPGMNYSCGYWKGARDLEEAQARKLELVCRKLGLRPGIRLLDIGCGWGSLARYAAERHGAEVVGITLSAEQKAFADGACRGLPVEIRLQDYRDLPDEVFDRVASIGMFEHVGHRNHAVFMDCVARHLAGDGVFLLHTIGKNATAAGTDPWIEKYIFPNGEIPSAAQITRAAEGRFVLEDWHNFGADYDRTLMAWHRNVMERWQDLKNRFNQRFCRMWTYYLLSCAGAFRARGLQLWQVVLSRRGIPGGLAARDL